MTYDIIIIGGGASGMCTAIKAKKANNSILIIDHNDRVGKKILSTGNGKCNLTNMFCVPEYMEEEGWKNTSEGIYPYFSSGDRTFVNKVIEAFDADDTIGFFASLGLFCFSRNGYVYPRAEQASVVLDTLRFECERLGADIITGYQPLKIEHSSRGFVINGEYDCRNLVLACGGMSASNTGSDGSGYEIAKSLGHSIIDPIPALCGIKCSDNYFGAAAGVRTDGKVTVFDENKKELISVCGNLQFNKWGISGIPVFQISSVAGRMMHEGRRISIKADLLPDMDSSTLSQFLDRIFLLKANRSGTAEDCQNAELTSEILCGLMNKKLAYIVARDSAKMGEMHKGESFGERLVPIIKRFRITPSGMASFDDAQTTSGGVNTSEIDPDTMESAICRNLFFAGEIMDVNGICGGYNLQWAWSTAHIAAKALVNR